MIAAAKLHIATQPAPICPACGASGNVALTNCRDYVCGLPGAWSFRECTRCHLLWLDPRPTGESIPLLYPPRYGFTRSPVVSEIGNENTFTGSVKLALVERVYGYPGVRSLGRSDLGARLGDLFAPVLSLARKAGYAVRFLPARPGGKLLDVGCGNGSFLHLMRRLAWEVQGIEPDPEAAAIAAAQNLCVEVADVTRAELPDSYFDAITLTHVAEHFPAPAAAFATLARALKPGGIIVSISPNPAGVVRRLFGNKWYQLDPPRHFVIPSERAYRAILEPLGFNVQIWTSMRMSYWAIRESMSIARAGAAHRSGGGFLSRLLHIGVVMVSFLLPGSGEEVICYATKK